MSKPHGQTVFLLAALLVAAALVGYFAFFDGRASVADEAQRNRSRLTLEDIRFDGQAAYEHLEQLCRLGPRPSGSRAMAEQQTLLEDYFRGLGGLVERQEFRVRHPRTGQPVPMANLIVTWHPERSQRILLCAHYDTRPFPDRDSRNPRGTFVGANDGASGVALLMELGRAMPALGGALGVDFVLLDGEEFVFSERDTYFLGAEHFARAYAGQPPEHRYRWGVLLDMVGDAQLNVRKDYESTTWRDTRPLVDAIWDTARRLGVREFIDRRGPQIRDDHLPLHNIAKIPICDVIDFDYPHWHTQLDTPENCSALSLAKVGWVIQTWLEAAVAK